MSQRNESYVVDILHAARLVQSFLLNVDRGAFDRDIMRQSAVVRQLEIIGEATKRLSNEFRDSQLEIPWRKMAGLRDVLIHAYQRVDIEEVWITATKFVPDLIRQIEPLVPSDE